MHCPKCKSAMIVVEYEGVELDHCPSCEGTWFDSDELRLLFEEFGSEAALRIPADIRSLPRVATKEKRCHCPICRRRMRKVSIPCAPDVLLDACARGDGIWFDRSEVFRLAENIAKCVPDVPARAMEFISRVFQGSAGPGSKEEGRE